MKRNEKQKETIKTTCFYQKEGEGVQKLVAQSFQNFVKAELMKPCTRV